MGHLQAAGAGQLVTVIQLRTLPFLRLRGRNQQRGNILGQNNKLDLQSIGSSRDLQ